MGGRGGASGFPANAPAVLATPQSAAETKDLHELAEYMKTVGQYGVYVDEAALSRQTFENVREAAASIEQIITEFPRAAYFFHDLRGDDLDFDVLAVARFSGVISLSNYHFSKSEDGLNYSYDKSTNNGTHPAGTTKRNIATHEAGHILELALIRKDVYNSGLSFYEADKQAGKAWTECTYASKVISEACKIAKKTPAGKGMKNNELIKSVSSYALKSKSEALAECVSDYAANGQNAKPLSVAVWSVLKRELG